MYGHIWHRVAESEVTVTDRQPKKQRIWVCERCQSPTVLDDYLDPESMSILYGIEPKQYDGTIVIEPLILSCDEEVVTKIMDC